MKQYHDLLQKCLDNGIEATDRTGVGRKRLIGEQMKLNLKEGFPLLTTKKIHFKSILHELIWFLRGDTNIAYLEQNGVTIWTDWAYKNYLQFIDQKTDNEKYSFLLKSKITPTNSDKKHIKILLSFIPKTALESALNMKDFGKLVATNTAFAALFGDLGQIYGHNWVSWGNKNIFDMLVFSTNEVENIFKNQIKQAKQILQSEPNSSRNIVTAWNPATIELAALPPCHYSFQLCRIGNTLDMIVNFRSNDLFLGTPFNIAQYALLCHLFAHDCGLEVGTLTYNIGDAHIYMNHYEQAKELLSRGYEVYALPTIRIEGERNLLDYTYSNNEKLESSGEFDWIGNGLQIDLKLRPENVVLENYHSYPAIKAQVAV